MRYANRAVAGLLVLTAGSVPSIADAQAGHVTERDQGLARIEPTSEPSTETTSTAQAGELQDEAYADEEIIVLGDPTLRALREELRAAEDRVHKLFNALNDDDEFDIHCYRETRTGTNISRRVCKPNYVDTATAIEARAYLNYMRGELGGAAAAPRSTFRYKDRILREKLTTLFNENAELRNAVTRHAELSSAFESTRQRIQYTND